MKKQILIALCLLWELGYAGQVFSQPPGIDDSIMSIKRKWKRSENHIHAVDAGLSPSHYPGIIKKLESVALLFQQAYPVPTGTDARWYPQIRGEALFPMGPAPYGFNSLFDYLYYNVPYKKIINAGETGTWAYAYFNSLGWLLQSSGVNVRINNTKKNAWQLAPESGTWKGYPVFEPPSFSPNAKLVLITKQGKWPLKPVSQLEYLEGLKEKQVDEKTKIIKEQEEGVAKSRKLINEYRESKNYTPEIKNRMIQAMEEQLKKQMETGPKLLKTAEDMFAAQIKIIDEYIAGHSPGELEQQAIVNTYQNFIQQKKFEEPSSKAARKLVYLDLAYFDKQLPVYEPQLCMLFWRWNNNRPGLYFKKQFEENFPVEKLKAILK